jgi:bifunctional non-homologous end joining protein LigD
MSSTPRAKDGGTARATVRPSDIVIPESDSAEIETDNQRVKLTNLGKVFWPNLNLTKRDLLQYYADMARYLVPHLKNRAMVMKRYPHGIEGEFFFMKRAPSPRPDWIQICSIEHASGNVIGFPVIQDLASLLWVVNLGCIDLNQWYATCDDINRPDYLHFDLDPVPDATFDQVLEAALAVHEALESYGISNVAKTTGSRGIHIYVPIVRGPTQKEVWTFAKAFAQDLAAQHPHLLTSEYRIRNRPRNHVLVDYNQNAWGRTLASVYSVRPKPLATVSTPVTWEEISRGIRIEDFRMDNVPSRVRKLGDLFKPLLQVKSRFRLEQYV